MEEPARRPASQWFAFADSEKSQQSRTIPPVKFAPRSSQSQDMGPYDGQHQTPRQEVSVLVLASDSTTLEESDFLRIGSQGEHIEGWKTGIIKVISGRDASTLEALGHYFILFSSDAQANAYLDQTRRLHEIAKDNYQDWGMSLPMPPGQVIDRDEARAVVRGFTLVPPHSRLVMRLAKRPYRPAMARILNDGGPAAVAARRSKAEHMVLISISAGHMYCHDLEHAIEDDSKRRNLRWRLAGTGIDMVRLKGRNQHVLSRLPGNDGDEMVETVPESSKGAGGSTSRFIVSFEDGHEARRFVREWHRRPFPIQKEHNLGSDLHPIVNAEILS